jgi:hypothetical protein
MRNLKLAVLFCQPTLLSSAVTLFTAVALLAVANLSSLNRSGQLYDFIFGPGTPIDLIQRSRDTLTAINQTVFGNTVLNQVLFFGFWMMIGLFVYITIAIAREALSDTDQAVRYLRYVHARRQLIRHNFWVRTALRTGGLLAAVLYGWILIRLLLPFCIFCTRVGLSELNLLSGWGYCLLGLTTLLVVLHGGIIIARLIAVRPRLFGEWDSLLLDEPA